MALAGVLLSTPAMAVKPGFYLGLSAGGVSTDVDEDGLKYDDSGTAYKVFAGYHFLQFFAVEGAYRDLGKVEIGNFAIEPTGFDIAGLVGAPLGPVYIFGKLGVIVWDTDVTTGESFDGTDYEVGLGASVDLWKIQLRAEAEYLDVLDGSLMYTVGAAWRF